MSLKTFLIFGLICLIHCGHCANILAITPVMSHSHHLWNRVLMIELAKRGHNVTYIGPDNEKFKTPNLTSIVLEGVYEKLHTDLNLDDILNQGVLERSFLLLNWLIKTCEIELNNDAVEILESYPPDAFDLIIVDFSGSDCFYPLITKFKSPPVIGVSPFGLIPWSSFITGGYEYPAFVPHYGLLTTNYMDLPTRILNFVISTSTLIYRNYFIIPKVDAFAKQRFGDTFSSVTDIEKNISILLINNDPIIDWPRPLLPNVIPVSGLHIPTPKPLSEELRHFVDNAEEIIIFSLGSNIQINELPLEKQQILLQAFSQLSQHVICRWNSSLKQPENVLFLKWLPQSDLLAHPKVKLLFTHGGLLSTQEAIYRGVPILGMPFFLDQESNMYMIVQRGYGIEISYSNLTIENVLTALKNVLYDPKIKENVKQASILYQDTSQSPLDKAVFWTEYILRHKAAPHLRLPTIYMPFYQTFSLDVVAILLLVFIIFNLFMYFVIKTLCTKTKIEFILYQILDLFVILISFFVFFILLIFYTFKKGNKVNNCI